MAGKAGQSAIDGATSVNAGHGGTGGKELTKDPHKTTNQDGSDANKEEGSTSKSTGGGGVAEKEKEKDSKSKSKEDDA